MRARLVLTCLLLLSSLPAFTQATFSYYDLPPSGPSVSGDFNRDGIPDLAVFDVWGDGALHVFFGTGGGQFKAAHTYGGFYTSSFVNLYTADMDNDGNLDLIVCMSGFPVTLLYGNAQGAFVRGPGIPSLAGGLSLGDLNNDGKVDLIGDRTYINLGARRFKTLWTTTSGRLADVNRDGVLDLVNLDSSGTGRIAVSFGKGDGTFKAPIYSTFLPTVCGASSNCTDYLSDFAIGDFYNDGNLDVAVLQDQDSNTDYEGGSSTVYTYRNDGTGHLTLSHTLSNLGLEGWTVLAADFNADQSQDLLLFNGSARYGGSEILYGRGDGSFTESTSGYAPASGVQGGYEFTRDLALTSRQDVVASAGPYTGPYDMISLNTTPAALCPPPGSGSLAAKICSPAPGSRTTSNTVSIQGSGNSPAGIKRVEIWIDGVKRSQRWADQIAQSFTLSTGTHKISIVAVDLYVGYAKSVETITVP